MPTAQGALTIGKLGRHPRSTFLTPLPSPQWVTDTSPVVKGPLPAAHDALNSPQPGPCARNLRGERRARRAFGCVVVCRQTTAGYTCPGWLAPTVTQRCSTPGPSRSSVWCHTASTDGRPFWRALSGPRPSGPRPSGSLPIHRPAGDPSNAILGGVGDQDVFPPGRDQLQSAGVPSPDKSADVVVVHSPAGIEQGYLRHLLQIGRRHGQQVFWCQVGGLQHLSGGQRLTVGVLEVASPRRDRLGDQAGQHPQGKQHCQEQDGQAQPSTGWSVLVGSPDGNHAEHRLSGRPAAGGARWCLYGRRNLQRRHPIGDRLGRSLFEGGGHDGTVAAISVLMGLVAHVQHPADGSWWLDGLYTDVKGTGKCDYQPHCPGLTGAGKKYSCITVTYWKIL
jgi:hypothetical protein